jgi:hypothetical protein
MRRIGTTLFLLAVGLTVGATAVGAADPPADTKAPAPAKSPEPATPTPEGSVPITPPPLTPEAVKQAREGASMNGSPEVDAALARVRGRANDLPEATRIETEKALRDAALQVDAAATGGPAAAAAGASAAPGGAPDKADANQKIASRLAQDFGVAPEQLLGERDRLKTGWGDLMIAHLIKANSQTPLTIDQLFDLRQERLGWGQIAHGVGLQVGGLVSAARAQGQVATGVVPADGKPEHLAAGSAASVKNAARAEAGKAKGEAGKAMGETGKAKGKGNATAAAAKSKAKGSEGAAEPGSGGKGVETK